MNTNNSASIIRSWISKSEKPQNKYNSSLRNAVSDWSGIVPSDDRDGYDTGNEPERHNFNE